MILNAAAKINLMLDILGKVEGGYHTLFMVMQSVGLEDRIQLTETGEAGRIEITCSDPAIPCDETNIAWKAAEQFFSVTGEPNPGLRIDIEKHIPSAAGLAGGSADGAAVFVGLNRMNGNKVSDRDLCRMAEKVGADIPFCIMGGTMLAMDVGGVLAPLPDLDKEWYVLVKPDQDVSTKEAYATFDRHMREVRHLNTNAMLRAVVNQDNDKVYHLVDNVFEQLIEVPDRVDIKALMRGTGAVASCMSGSGPSIFGIFTTKEEAKNCTELLRKKNFTNVFVCRPTRCGVTVEQE